MRNQGSAPRTIFRCDGGSVVLPDQRLVLVDRRDGGNLIVNPPHEVWERSELTSDELIGWSFLVASTGRAMIDALPQLEGGCVNYWEAGNWALHHDAPPEGPKNAPEHRRVHLHLLGRSREATHPSWQWGEAPFFPLWKDRFDWAAGFERLTPAECQGVVARIEELLIRRYAQPADTIEPTVTCSSCNYPTPAGDVTEGRCRDCL
jgi:hypothetical protein